MIVRWLGLTSCALTLVACSAPGGSKANPGATALDLPGQSTSVTGGPSVDTNAAEGNAPASQGSGEASGDPRGSRGEGLLVDQPSDDTPVAPATCVGEAYEAERLPVDIYFLVDVSGSMADDTANGVKWDLVSRALVEFLGDPSNEDTGVGIGYFPVGADESCTAGDDDCLCIPFTPICISLLGGSCEGSDYVPAVPLALPPDTAPVIADINAKMLSGGTPTRAALEGALDYASSWASEHPGRRTVVVLATDGEPTGCPANAPADVAAVAASAFQGPQAIRTFVVGVGNSLTSLNLIAEQGGTKQAFLTDINQDLVQELGKALSSIRDEAVQCEFAIPTDDAAAQVDAGLVNVLLTSTGAAAAVVPMTAGGEASSCGADGGWHYDNSDAPTSIKLCESTCQAAQQGARIEIEYGCRTVTIDELR
jgi:uncharacterized protein YegL